MTFLQRNDLIFALLGRGFREAHSLDGWRYIHRADRFEIWFNASGRYKLTVPGKEAQFGVATEQSQILAHIDREAAAL